MIATLLIVTQLQRTPVIGVNLKPAYTITESNDIQPALGVNYYQTTLNPQVKAWVFGQVQPAARQGVYQRTFNPQIQN